MNENELDLTLRAIGKSHVREVAPPALHELTRSVIRQPAVRQRFPLPLSTGRFPSMFSALKFVVAGVIVALFGGFLLSGVLTQPPSDEPLPAVGASASATAQAEPTTEATAESEPVPEATEVLQSDSNLGPGTFTSTGSLDRGRAAHTATLLSDGRVLVVGGSEGMDYVTPAEAWDPVTGSFSPAGSLAEGRWAHTATLLADGRVLVAGGSDNDMGFVTGLASAEIWDPTTESFSPAGPLLQARGWHTATPLPDGRVLVIGGVVVENEAVRSLASAEVWDPATESFRPAGSLDAGHVLHTATPLPDGRVLVVGGVAPDSDPGGYFASAEIWDPATESFSPAGTMTEGRSGHTATLLDDGRVLIVGAGGSAESTGTRRSPSVPPEHSRSFAPDTPPHSCLMAACSSLGALTSLVMDLATPHKRRSGTLPLSRSSRLFHSGQDASTTPRRVFRTAASCSSVGAARTGCSHRQRSGNRVRGSPRPMTRP